MKDFNIHEDGNKVLTESVLNAVDENNVIAQINQQTKNITYTAIEDCYVSFSTGRGSVITINGIDIGANGMMVPYRQVSKLISNFECFRLKKGDVFIASAGEATTMTLCVFGIKR